MKSPTFVLYLVVKDEDLNDVKSINVTDFRLEETGLPFFDDKIKECKEILFKILRKENYEQ